MKQTIRKHLLFIIALVASAFLAANSLVLNAQATSFQLSSPVVSDGGTLKDDQVASGFGCTGKNISPELNWKGAPEGTKSFALTVYDPDAPTGSGFWHWVIFNISPTTTSLPAGAGDPSKPGAPAQSIQVRGDAGAAGYFGPCPPQGDKPHHYIFTLFALKLDKLPLDNTASGALVGFYLNANVLAKASFTATYGRPSPFQLSSPVVSDGGTLKDDQVASGFGCTGKNISPELNWKGAPEGTKSFALTVYDPDAPTGSGFWHWVIFNISPTTTSLPAGAGDPTKPGAPAQSIQVRGDAGSAGYFGPCPPQGDKPHHYIFTLFALSLDKLPLDNTASGALVGFYLNFNALGKASFTATYGR